ncbi:RUN domain-containing protein 1 [Bacillus rossius redtenbacheri]|uniref:RUN domain-containing protein 1 n=1 Tax=Bacillus rossius redtenbacheri TaxID=93214 RepID=UPI002FDEABA1
MMEEVQNFSELEEMEFCDGKPTGERWPPVGANACDEEVACYSQASHGLCMESQRLRDLEEQQEMLNSSLIALTTHFAQVQFRLRQIVEASPSEKESLLKDLEAFAFRGIPEVRNVRPKLYSESLPEGEDLEEKMLEQRSKQKELISQLKSQLEDLEKYAYETGEAGLPQCVILERQKVILDQLKGKLNLNVDDIDKLTADELRNQVDYAVSQLVNPLKVKEHLVMQLKTQITDLERFIHFLQGETTFEAEGKKCTCSCHQHYSSGLKPALTGNSHEEIRKETVNIMRKASTLLQMFAAAQFGCGADHFQKNLLKRTGRGRHWGDLRARLEVAVNYVLELMSRTERSVHTDYSSDSEDVPVIVCDAKLAHAVRKQLALSIRDLMQHGLMPIGQSESVVPFVGCFAHTQSPVKTMHAWELVLKYYELKNGERFNSTPARTLSQSFKLDIVGGTAISSKQNLLSIIGNILTTHTQYKRSYDSHFKAFVCAALNQKKLVTWIRLILHCQTLLDWYYQPWSYVVKTGFEDGYESLDRLTHLKFELPVDLAVRQFQNIKDAF